MPRPERHWLRHTPASWVSEPTYFVTICCASRRANQLCYPPVARKLFAAVHHYQEQLRWHVSLWLLMPDHLHALITLPRDEGLAKLIPAWKRFTARDSGVAWQAGFFDHRIRSDESLQEKAHYIRMNPVRQRLVAQPEDWPHVISSTAD
jgi:REP element-mobilizing transposase RayT